MFGKKHLSRFGKYENKYGGICQYCDRWFDDPSKKFIHMDKCKWGPDSAQPQPPLPASFPPPPPLPIPRPQPPIIPAPQPVPASYPPPPPLPIPNIVCLTDINAL